MANKQKKSQPFGKILTVHLTAAIILLLNNQFLANFLNLNACSRENGSALDDSMIYGLLDFEYFFNPICSLSSKPTLPTFDSLDALRLLATYFLIDWKPLISKNLSLNGNSQVTKCLSHRLGFVCFLLICFICF